MKASDLFVKALENERVEYIFGIPGEENLDFLESLRTSRIKLILTRHEQAAGFMAAAYGRLTGKPGVCLSTLGPGATNLVTAAAYAQLGAMPLVMITGQKPIKKSKQGRFQILDVVEMLRPLTKSSRQIVDATRIPSLVRESFRLAIEERPGVVHLELPEDIAADEIEEPPLFEVTRARRPSADAKALATAVELIRQAKSPLIFMGAGANRKRTSSALKTFVDKLGVPFFSTQMGVGVLDSRHPLSLGVAALTDRQFVHSAIHHADLIISVGHDVVEKPPFLMERSEAKVIHVNFSPATVDDVYFPNHEVVGDIAFSIGALTESLQAQPHWDFSKTIRAKELTNQRVASASQSTAFPLMPQKVVADVRAAMPSDGIVCLDNGMYKLWFASCYPVHLPNTLLLDNALATMGAGLPSAIAARLVHPERKVLAVCGDGGFMMNSQEIETAVRLGLNLVVVILNDSGYGMIKWKQSALKFESWGLDFANPDFVALAAAYGASGHRVENAIELSNRLEFCLKSPGVHIIDVPIEYSDDNRLTDDLDILEMPLQTAAKGGSVMSKDSGGIAKLEVFSPYSREQIASLQLAGPEQVSQSLEVAYQLFQNRENWLAPHQRIAIFERLATLMEAAKESLIATALSEGGKPYADTCIEVERAIQGVKLGVQAVHSLHGEQVPMGLSAASEHRLAFTAVEPIGVVVALSAFNHPLNLVVHQVVPAIAAGCPVIIKPAPATPLSCLAFVQLLQQAGLPEGWCQVLLLDNANAEKLATDRRVGYLSFIGSAKIGWYLRSKLAPGVRCGLEHGGLAPVIVERTANLAEAVPSIVKGGFYHAGQVCVSVQRVFVHESMLAVFKDLIQTAVNGLKVGDPEKHDTDVGPLINPREVDRVASWVEEAVQGGGEVLCGGKKLSDTCYAPTVLINPPATAKVSTEEIFGPVVCLYSYQDINQAISLANSLPYAFQAAVFAKDVDVALHAASSLNASSVMVNDHTAFRVDWMPFGGRGESGLGVGGIAHSAREMSTEKLVVFKSSKLA